MNRKDCSKFTRRSLFFSCLAVFTSLPVLGEKPKKPEAITELKEYVVEGLSARDSVNPLSQSVGSVYGMERDLLSIPRSVSVISEALLRDRGVDSVEEIIPFSPSTYSPSSYGQATTPNIRGDVAEFYVNGQRRSANEFGFDPSFNSVESIDIVRGPGTVSYGPGFYSGGYVNYVTKKPRFDAPRTELSFQIGSWVPGHDSYMDAYLRLDHNTILFEDKLALRISYEAQENDTFFKDNGGRDDHQDIFLALAWRPNDRLKMDFNAQYSWQAAPELLGVNRPYNGLVKDNLYLQGKPTDPPVIAPDFFSIKTKVTGTTDFDPQDTLLSTGDFSNANIVSAQLVTTLDLRPNLKVTNRTFFEHVKRRRFHEFSYAEYVEQLTFETRTEVESDFRLGKLQHHLLTGISLRFEEREAYLNYLNYYPYAFDVTAGPPFRAEGLYGLFGQPGPGGRLFFGAQQGIPETTDSKLWNPALFWQHEIVLTDKFSLLYGLRGNAYFADVTDPLPPPGAVKPWNDSHDFYNGDVNVSFTFKPTPKASLFATFNRTHAVDGSTGGGGIMLRNKGKLDGDDFGVRSELLEAGVRFSLMQNRLYLAGSFFQQKRFRSQLGGSRNGIEVSGFELESVFQKGEDFYFLANLSYNDAHYNNASPFVLGGVDLNGLYTVAVADPADPALIGPDGQVIPGDYRVSGISTWVFNAGFSRRFKNGFGLRFWGSAQSEQNGNLLGQYVIPAQFELNSAFFLKRKKWEASISLLNLTDERNWIHNGDEFGSNTFIARNLPFRLEAQFTFHLR